ncbi:MAG: carbamoyltransferase [Chitinophagia bacterium]|nr:carbamoyltransferase [Chitinophagia bacterium]
MYVLGLNAFHADSSAAIFRDGIMIAATEEERFTRVKHWAGFPSQAVRFCLHEAGIGLSDVDHITIGRDPRAKFFHKLSYLLRNPSLVAGAFRRLGNSRDVANLEDLFHEVDPSVPSSAVRSRIRNIEHHRSHLASAFYASPFEEAALLSIDGSGDFTTTMMGVGRGTRIEVIDSVDFPASIGLFYTAFTQFLGFPHYGDEYKVMGLAPYGEPRYVDKVLELVHLKPEGLFGWDARYFVPPSQAGFEYIDHVPSVGNLYASPFLTAFGQPRQKGEALTQYHRDLAASVQRATEQIIFHLLRTVRQRTGLDNVCVAGGVAQNSVANGKMAEATGFKGVYIPSAGHDAGISMGSALYQYHHVLGRPRNPAIRSAYTGIRFGNEEIEVMLRARGIAYRRMEDDELYDAVTNKLLQPGVVGWFQGRAEFGPRALGGRSILADPRNPEAKDLLNLKIKRRESFRPFAPSILREYTGEWFTRTDDVPFMEKVFPIRPEKRAEIPAVTHVDGTGRLQTVDSTVSPRYHALIDAFRRKTGVPILLNTSFNENEPIVNTPQEALDCYLRTRMDMLVLENCVIERGAGDDTSVAEAGPDPKGE